MKHRDLKLYQDIKHTRDLQSKPATDELHFLQARSRLLADELDIDLSVDEDKAIARYNPSIARTAKSSTYPSASVATCFKKNKPVPSLLDSFKQHQVFH
jgi:hypothetical protein